MHVRFGVNVFLEKEQKSIHLGPFTPFPEVQAQRIQNSANEPDPETVNKVEVERLQILIDLPLLDVIVDKPIQDIQECV